VTKIPHEFIHGLQRARAFTTASHCGDAATIPPTSGRYSSLCVRGLHPHDPVRHPGKPRHLNPRQRTDRNSLNHPHIEPGTPR